MWFTKKKQKKGSNAVPAKEDRRYENDLEAAPIQLVKGRFNAVEAADILISLINDKIRYHTIKTLNMQVAEDHRERSQQRIDELRQAKERIKELIIRGNKLGKQVEIDSSISIRLVDLPAEKHMDLK